MVHDNFKDEYSRRDFSRNWSLVTVPDKWREHDRRRLSSLDTEHEEGFDELWLGGWLHIEQMDDNYYWMRVGSSTLHIYNTKSNNVVIECHEEGDWVHPDRYRAPYDIINEKE